MLWPYFKNEQVVAIGTQNAHLGSRQSSQRYFKDPETPYTGEVALTSIEVEKTKDLPLQAEKEDLAGNEYVPIVEHSDAKVEVASKESAPAADLVDLPEDLYEDINDGTRDRRSCLNVSTSKSQLVPQQAGAQNSNPATNEVLYEDTGPQPGEEDGYVISQLVYDDSVASRAHEDQGADMYEVIDIENSWQTILVIMRVYLMACTVDVKYFAYSSGGLYSIYNIINCSINFDIPHAYHVT